MRSTEKRRLFSGRFLSVLVHPVGERTDPSWVMWGAGKTRTAGVGGRLDPLGSGESAVLSEGVKFVFGQLTDLLTRLRDHRKHAGDTSDESTKVSVEVAASEALDGELKPAAVSLNELERLEPRMRELRRLLVDYIDGIEPVNAGDRDLLEAMAESRLLLELLLGQRITFQGENAPRTGATIEVDVRATQVDGYMAGVRARRIGSSAHVSVQAAAGEIRAGGSVVGVDAETIGEDGSRPIR